MKRMLINATQEEELRMAMVDGQRLYDLNIELPAGERKKANIYKGKITRIEPSLEAAFVSYGGERHGFLPLKEISSEYFIKQPPSGNKVNIKDVLKEGQDIVVQVDKEERGNKGAALTTFVSLAGRFIVLKPNKSSSGGVSRRIIGEDRDLARQSLREVSIPDGMSVILRTAGIDRTAEELEWDLNNLLAVWRAILKVVVDRPSPFLIYRESDAVVRALRDYFSNDIGEILIDDEATYKEALEFVEQVMPHNVRKLKHYADPVPLFTRYQIESQIESAFAHSVNLPSGGSVVIDHTEALVSIDVNSARATKGANIETTAFNTNLEAADEVGRQLRLRDLGGLVVIDFIDMGPQKNQREVENRLRDAVKQDRARVQFGKISRFGLLEMSRQRLRPSLGESSYLTCPRCSGIGNIRSVESLALAILRLIGEEARKERTAKVIAQLPVEVATYLLNEKRDWVQSLESRNDTQVILVANSLLETPHYQIRRVRDDQVELAENSGTSYTLTDSEIEQLIPEVIQERKPTQTAAIATVVPPPAPPRKQKQAKAGPTLWERVKRLFSSDDDKQERDRKRPGNRQERSRNDSRSRGGQRTRGRKSSQQQVDKRTNDNRNKTQNKRSPKKRTKKPAEDASEKQTAKQNTHDDSSGEPRKTGKKRRSRGGRRRNRSNTNAESTPEQQSEISNATDTAASTDSNVKNETVVAVASVAAASADQQTTTSNEKSRDDSQPQQPVESAETQVPTNVEPKPAPRRRKPKPRVEEVADTAEATAPKAIDSSDSEPKKETKQETKQETKSEINVDDTQPELPRLNLAEIPEPVIAAATEEAAERKPQASKPSVTRDPEDASAAVSTPVKAEESKPKPEQVDTAKVESEPREKKKDIDEEAKAAAKPAAAETRSDGSPKSRLLPWDVETAAAEAAKPDDTASEA